MQIIKKPIRRPVFRMAKLRAIDHEAKKASSVNKSLLDSFIKKDEKESDKSNVGFDNYSVTIEDVSVNNELPSNDNAKIVEKEEQKEEKIVEKPKKRTRKKKTENSESK